MKKTIFVTASVLGMLSVVLGAFGAHGLEKLVDAESVSTFETGVKYQMYHAFFLFVLGLMPEGITGSKKLIFLLTLFGVILFSFSIYVLSLNDVIDFDFGIFGIITPIGGALLIAAWGILGYRILKSKM